MKTQSFFLLFLLLLVSFPFLSCEIEITELILQNNTITMSSLSNSEYYFKVLFPQDSSIPNYLKIVVTQNEYGQYINNYIISYYGNDSNFKDRTQTSMSKVNIGTLTYLWLNKAQIKDGFYFKVEVQDKNTQFSIYQIDIIKYNFLELNTRHYFYKYYITKENQQMNFLIKGEENFFKEDNITIIVWAEGNKKIIPNINATNFVKHSKFNSFIIYNITQYEEYILSVDATLCDLVDVGVLFVSKKTFYDDFAYTLEHILKIFLKKNILEEICFEESRYIKYMDDINRKIDLEGYIGNKRCLKLPEEMDELFLYIHYLWYFGYPLMKNAPVYYSLLTGIDYYETVYSSMPIGYIPLDIDEDTNFLTYTIYTLPNKNIKADVYIANCTNYPSCVIDKSELENSIYIHKNLDSYTYTFTKDEIADYISGISNKRKIIFLKCNEEKECEFFININTDKTKMKQSTLKYNYFTCNKNINNLIISPLNYAATFPLEFIVPTNEVHLEQLSGEISFSTEKKYINYNDSYYIFPLESDEEILNLKIESKKNSLYSIKICYIFMEYYEGFSYNKIIAPQSGNYMFNLNFEKGNMVTLDFYQTYSHDYFNNFFYPINCQVEIEYEHYYFPKYNIAKYQSPDGTIFYHDMSIYGYYNIYSLDNEKSCKIYVSTYSLDMENFNSTENGIILKENSPQVFLISNNNLNIHFNYYFKDLNSDIKLKITLLNKGDFWLYTYFNDILGKILGINSTQIITIDESYWRDVCEIGQICKFSYIIIKKDDENTEHFVQITINPLINEDEENEENNNKKNYGIKIFVLLFVVLVLAGFIFMIYYKKIDICSLFNKKKNKPFEMEQFEDDDLKNNDLILDNKK